MKKQIITVAMLMMSMSFNAQASDPNEFVVDSLKTNTHLKLRASEKNGVYNLFYAPKTQGYVYIKIYNESGSVIYSGSAKSFDSLNIKRSFDFSKLPYGTYKFKVLERGMSTSESIDYSGIEEKLDVKVAQTKDKGKYSLNVFRENQYPVYVNIYDDQQNVLYHDKIEASSNFSRVYDLSKITSKEVSFEVFCGNSKVYQRVQY